MLAACSLQPAGRLTNNLRVGITQTRADLSAVRISHLTLRADLLNQMLKTQNLTHLHVSAK